MDNEQGASEWQAAWGRVWDLVEADGTDLETTVPACPAWSALQLVAHMVGLVADVVDGVEPGDDGDAWTRRQVERRADRSVGQLHEEWTSREQAAVDWMRAHGTRPLGDVVIHEQDLREALGVPGARDTDGLRAVRDRMADGFAAAAADLPPIALVSPTWSTGTAADPSEAAVVVEADEFTLTRALMTRRSAAQLRAWTTRGDVEPYLPAFSALGALPEQDAS